MAKAQAQPGEKKRGGKGRIVLIMIVIGAAMPFMMPTVTLVLLGMLPTIVVLLTDQDHDRSSTAAVGMMNFAGVTPFVIDLWVKGQTMENTFHMLGDSSTWLIMLGAAGIGQLIVFAIPQAMASLALARAESRLTILKDNLEQLRAAWGPDVATTKPVDKIVRGE